MILFLDILTIMFLFGMGIIGFKRGLVEEIGRLVGLIVSVSFAWNYYVQLSGLVLSKINLNPWVVVVFSFSFIFFIILILVRLITRFIHLLLLSQSTKLLNRGMGFVFGSIKAALVMTVFLWIVEISPNNKWSKIIQKESIFASSMTSFRMKVLHTFRLTDPVEAGEKFIREFMESKEDKDIGKD